jgi:NTP pyrophosphatase (non-canonical NTP hydrolase)
MDDTVWDTVDRLAEWLDEGSKATETERKLLRVMKLSEEAGEAAQAAQGALGENPRKGQSHTWDDVDNEVCDVIITGLVTLRSLNPAARKKFEERLAYITQRAFG